MRIIIIGAGPGGYETALEAAKRGIEVVLVSEGPLGGTCLNEGCIPTKTFVHYAECGGSDLSELQARKTAVVEQLRSGVESLMRNKLITLVYGHGEFVDGHTVRVGDSCHSADKIIVATGSTSASLPIPGAELAISSREALNLDRLPARICVIGGGVIGLEFASVFSALGAQVSVLEYCPNILPRFDVDLAKRLKTSLSKRGISIETSAQVTSIRKPGDAYCVSFTKKDVGSEVEADCVLMAVGRRANVSGLNLEAAGVETSRRGIVVDDNMRTSAPDIYAIGDVTGGIMLAHVATFQGFRALDDICGVRNDTDFSIVPAAVFTSPEVASVGITEEDAKEKNLEIRCLKSFYRANGKAVSMDAAEGYCKIIADASTGRILGGHIMGAHASDLIHELAVLMNFGATAVQARSIVHAHPTLSEVLLAAFRTF